MIDEILALLYNMGYINNPEQMPIKKPTHGSCCTCQTCGYYHDECICEDNILIAGLIDILPPTGYHDVEKFYTDECEEDK